MSQHPFRTLLLVVAVLASWAVIPMPIYSHPPG